MKMVKGLASAIALASGAVAVPANALTFVLTDTGGTAIGTQARQGFEIAASYWSRVFTDNVTVNLNIGFNTLGTGILGSTGSTRSLLSMNQGYAALAADATSTFDFSSVASLQPLGVSNVSPAFGAVTFTANDLRRNGTGTVIGYTDTATRIDNDGSVNNSTLAITKASAKALGLRTDVNGNTIDYGSSDGSVTFSDAFSFDFDPTDGIDANSFDFIGVAIHEIGHALGFVSGVDSYDSYTAPGGSNTRSGALEGFVVNSQLDLFRYGSAGRLDWSTQSDVYFSVDGGRSQVFGESWMSTGRFNGDGRQASHFRDSPAGQDQLGVMDPTSGRGQMQEITGLDLAAFDVIGWNLRGDTAGMGGYRVTTAQVYSSYFAAVPEPAVWVQLILGFGVIGGSLRYRRRLTTRFA